MRLQALFVLCLVTSAAGCSKIELYSNLPEQEANEMMGILLQQGIACEKTTGEEGTWNLSVAEAGFSQAVTSLKEQGFPRKKFVNMGEAFQKSGLVSSPTEERIRFMHALSEELSHTISQIDGVLTARVHIVLPNNSPFGEEIEPSSASVFVKHHLDADIDEKLPQIRTLVMNSVQGLQEDSIATVLDPADPIPVAASLEPPKWVDVLSVKVAPQSVQRMWMLFGGMAVAVVVCLVLASVGFTKRQAAS